MTDMDWADEIAVKLFDAFCADDNIVEPTAAALRKAKADGMRECASVCEALRKQDTDACAALFRKQADVLQPPTE